MQNTGISNIGYRPFCTLTKTVDIPIELYKSLRGEYFITYADQLSFGMGKSAYARLYNPPGSGVNLQVNVWTVTDVSSAPIRAQFWFNAAPPAAAVEYSPVTPTNTAIYPPPVPKVLAQLASDVTGEPNGGIKAFVRRAQPEVTLVETENGKLIFPPGGSFMIFLSTPETPEAKAYGRIALGWWEEQITRQCMA